MIRLSTEESTAVLAASYRREQAEVGAILILAEIFSIPMQELRIGFREYDEAHFCISLETLNLELHGAS